MTQCRSVLVAANEARRRTAWTDAHLARFNEAVDQVDALLQVLALILLVLRTRLHHVLKRLADRLQRLLVVAVPASSSAVSAFSGGLYCTLFCLTRFASELQED